MKIGSVDLASPFVVAPMAGMTDSAFRRLVKRHGGCGLVVTEMVSSDGLVRGIDRTLEYAEYEGRAMIDRFMMGEGSSGVLGGYEQFFRGWMSAAGIPAEEILEHGMRFQRIHREATLWRVVRPGTIEALERLKSAGFKLAVVSNAEGQVESDAKRFGLAHFFDTIIDSHVVGVAKPDPRIFRATTSKHRVEWEIETSILRGFDSDMAPHSSATPAQLLSRIHRECVGAPPGLRNCSRTASRFPIRLGRCLVMARTTPERVTRPCSNMVRRQSSSHGARRNRVPPRIPQGGVPHAIMSCSQSQHPDARRGSLSVGTRGRG